MCRTIVLSCLFIVSILADCPLISYPRNTIIGNIKVQIDNDPKFHGKPFDYTYPLNKDLSDGAVGVAIGVNGLQINPHNLIDFNIEYIPSTVVSTLKFKIKLNDPAFGWTSLSFNFLATQSFLFQAFSQTVTQFSAGLGPGKYSLYRPIPNFNNFQIQPVIKIFIAGLTLKTKPLDAQYNSMVAQYESFRKFSTNARLIQFFTQAIQLKKALIFNIIQIKIIGRIYSFAVQTNSQLLSLTYSFIIFSKKSLTELHNFIEGDLSILNNSQYKISSLQNMGMLITGLSGFKIPRQNLYTLELNIANIQGQTYFGSKTNYNYFDSFVAFIAFQMKFNFACQDCPKSPIIFDNKFCVQQCPRSYSITQQGNLKYCDKCQVQKLKIVDLQTGNCVCAKRYYLDVATDTCKPCSYDCMTCTNSDKCLSCDNSLMQTKRKLNNAGRCLCPSTGFYDDINAQNVVCQKCNPDCLTCNGPKQHNCLTCDSSRQLDSNAFCVCKNGFVQDAFGNCICVPPLQLTNDGICVDLANPCGPTKDQQIINQIRRCVCKAGFIAVKNQCIRCGQNSQFNKETVRCQCIQPTIDINGTCVNCGVNQVYDPVYKICLCTNGSYKKNDGNCITCPAKMVLNNQVCQCIYNFYETSPGVCKPCLRQTDGPMCNRNLF